MKETFGYAPIRTVLTADFPSETPRSSEFVKHIFGASLFQVVHKVGGICRGGK